MTQAGTITERSWGLMSRPERLLVPLTIFLGALLLFAVEPLIAKAILPWFGGAADVWIACLLFFQSALLVGYVYAHLLARHVRPAWQWRVHLLFLSVSLLSLPIIPSEHWKPNGGEEPLVLILLLLTGTIGLPFVLLAATGPLLQSWLARSCEEAAISPRSVYRLYALSNVASLIALLSYPVLVEPILPIRAQAWSWSLLYCAFALIASGTAWSCRDLQETNAPLSAVAQRRAGYGQQVIWFLLAMAPSALLLAMTHYVVRNIAAIPLFWIVPLSLYLLSLIIAFDHSRWYWRPLWYALFVIAAPPMILFSVGDVLSGHLFLHVVLCSAGLFIFCMLCHGELAASKPEPAYLTRFYLIVAAGGAAGGMLVAAIAPFVFSDDYDLPILLPAVSLLLILIGWRHIPGHVSPRLRWGALLASLYGWLAVTGLTTMQLRDEMQGSIISVRNFYGALRVTLNTATETTGAVVQLRNGNIIHGREFVAPEKRCEPVSYYAPQSGVGTTLKELGQSGPLKVGVIGLGAGTLAAYGRQGDVFRFYELNPFVERLARTQFHYLSCPGQSTVVIGDARLSLEREAPQGLDVLVIDAFTSDAIPTHLLTLEAFQTYWRHLKPNGVLAVHVTNRYVNLWPVVAMAASQSGKKAFWTSNFADYDNAIDTSFWVLVTSRANFPARPGLNEPIPLTANTSLRPWTDDYSNLWQVLR